jgi:LmbE family N-acetylglucosaminyl deacetylase
MVKQQLVIMRILAILCFLSGSIIGIAQPIQPSSSEILIKMKKLNVLGSALYVAAHPDDENTRLIGYLAKEELVNTGYLALTRGDGGQNLIGPELGEGLGLIRTQELLAARGVDGSSQFFSRANDFGYSKTAKETLKIWDRDQVLHDVVWTIRKFRPDVVIMRFPPDERAGHGHHTTSAIMAEEAFDVAATQQYEEQLKSTEPWQVQRLMLNSGR